MSGFSKRLARRVLGKLGEYFYKETLLKNRSGSRIAQLALSHHYKSLAGGGSSLPRFSDVGFREFSEFEEDGILLYLFSLIPPHTRTCLEMCAGHGMECNTTNLIVNHGWWGHLFDGSEQNVLLGRDFFSRHRDTFLYPPRFSHAWITAENVNALVQTSGLSGRIDLFSLDMDGMDYWVWKAMNAVDPTVVVCEINNAIPPDEALTVPYESKFVAPDGDYRGASLKAMCHLAKEKGYRLVGTHRFGFNAFFVKQGVAEELLPAISPTSCADDPFTKLARDTRWQGMKHKPWTRV